MLKNILLSLVFVIGILGQCSAQSEAQTLEPNQVAHSNERLDSIKNTMLAHGKEKEERFMRVQKNPRDLKQIYLEGSFFAAYPNLGRGLLKDVANYWVWNFPWSAHEEKIQKALIDAQLVDEHGIVFEEVADTIYKNLTLFFMDEPVENDLGASLREHDISSLYENLEENQIAHKAMYPVIIEDIYKEISTEFDYNKQKLITARKNPEDITATNVNATLLCELYPVLTRDVAFKLAQYFVFNEPWSTFDFETKNILQKAGLVNEDGLIKENLITDLFFLTYFRFKQDDDLCPAREIYIRGDDVRRAGVERKIAILEHIRQNPNDFKEVGISSVLLNKFKFLGIDHTITTEDMVNLFYLWLFPRLWHQFSAQEQQSLIQTGYIDRRGIISYDVKLSFFIGFNPILEDHVKDKFPEIPGYESEKLVGFGKVNKAENQ